MNGQYTASLMYGVEDSEGWFVDESWLERNFPGMGMYALHVVKHEGIEAVAYGYPITISVDTDKANINEDTKNKVKELYEILCKHHAEKGHKAPKLGYHSYLPCREGMGRDIAEYTLSDK